MEINVTDILTFLVTPLVSGLFAWIIAKNNNDTNLFQTYIQRLSDVEDEVSTLKDENMNMKELFSIATSLIDQLVLWFANGSKGPKPKLHHKLKQYIDNSFWSD